MTRVKVTKKDGDDDGEDGAILCPCNEYIEGAGVVCCDECSIWWHIGCVGLLGLEREWVDKIVRYLCPRCYKCPYVEKEVKVNKNGKGPKSSENSKSVDQCTKEDLQMELLKIVPTITASVKSALGSTVTACKVAAEAAQKEIKSYAKTATDKQRTLFQDFERKTNEKSESLAKKVVNETAQTAVAAGMQKIDCDNIEREKRRCNVMIKNVPESFSSDKKICNIEDKAFVVNTIGINVDDIQAVFRAGTRLDKDGNPRAGPRPLIIVLCDEEEADYWCRNGKGFETDDGYWVNRDLCKADRVANFQARKVRRARMGRRDSVSSTE